MSVQKNNPILNRLKSKTVIDRLFLEGEGVHSKHLFIRLIQEKESPYLYAGVSVSKRNFKKAVDRNRIKRQLRIALKAVDPIPFRGSFMLVYKGRKLPKTQELVEESALLFAKITSL
jgi:ribonuclease P protein component